MTHAPFTILLALLIAALLLSLVAKHLRMPPAAAYVIGGMALALTPAKPPFTIDPEFILTLFLPPLLQASAYFTVWRDFKANLRPILMLAIGAVIFTTLVVGLVVHALLPELPLAAGFCLGAIVSPPDAVAAKAVLQRVPVPPRLVTILEGESLVNDASGLMLYRLAAAAALTGVFDWSDAAIMFGRLSAGGVAVGLVAGLFANGAMSRLRDTQLLILASFLISWATYVGAEALHVSGVLAVVTAGLLMGWAQHAILDAQSRIEMQTVWRAAVFVMEAMVFILIGLALRKVVEGLGGFNAAAASAVVDALIVTAAVIGARFVWVFPATYLPRLAPAVRNYDPCPSVSVPIVVGWAGMRGVVSLAAALALPADFPGRDFIVLATFVVIAVTVLLQGATLGPLVDWLKPTARPPGAVAHLDDHAAREKVYQAAILVVAAEVDGDGKERHPMLLEDYRRRVTIHQRAQREGDALIETKRAHFAMALAAVGGARAELLRLHRAGDIHDATLHAIEAELDLEESRLQRLSGEAAPAH
ncbi:Na+/H+ antiporter [Methylocystis sp. JR02]|uniref:Na+/H+ antiporter n=1 Tax=Methylocystis sp. JR02 TaxID=3046284 RepID=UPI0024BBE175|nr:Na+/H+ antiporter [Methylocystis sp. JR02]MDJ0450573.1 Na+/H+ antiporter [Methylocystis sp. JR02]